MKLKTYLSILVTVIAISYMSAIAEDKPANTEPAEAPVAEAKPAEMPAMPEMPELSPDTVILKINDKTITLGELDEKLEQVPEYQRGAYYPRVLEMLAQSMIQDAFIESKGLTVDEKAYEEKLAELQEQYEKILEDLKKRVEDAKVGIRRELTFDGYTDKKVTDEAVAEYIKANPHMFDGSKVKVSHVLIECKSFASSEEKAQAKDKLQNIHDQIINGDISFEDAAKQFSSCPSKEKGGDLGEIEVGGSMDAVFTEKAFKTPVGEISEPFLTTFGWHIVKVTDATMGDGEAKTVKVRGKEMTPQELASNTLKAKVQNEMLQFANESLKIENMGLPKPQMPAMPNMPRPRQ